MSDAALTALLNYQQADEDGVMVLVSRQAIHEVADEITRLRAEVGRFKEQVEHLCSYPLCDCRSEECLVLQGPIPGKNEREALLARAEAAEAKVERLENALNEAAAYGDEGIAAWASAALKGDGE